MFATRILLRRPILRYAIRRNTKFVFKTEEYKRMPENTPKRKFKPVPVEILCERIETSNSLEDKRKSLLELRELSENCKLVVGTRSIDVVFGILKEFFQDRDSVVLGLDIIANVIKERNTIQNSDLLNKIRQEPNLSGQFCEIVLKNNKNVEILIKLTEHDDFQIRWAVLKLFLILAKSQLFKFQQILSEIHFGVTRVLNYLSEPREFIRNDGIILLMTLSLNNQTMQKILAFENIFERLWDIIDAEGAVDGGIVVQDCIIIITNIVNHNDCTQKHFKESGLFDRVKSFFDLTIDSNVWPTNKTNCFISLLNCLRAFLDPIHESLHVKMAQNVINSAGIFEKLLNFTSFANLPENARIELFLTISECIRANDLLQKAFSAYMRAVNDNKPEVQVILAALINPKNSHLLKHSILYLFTCLLNSNHDLIRLIVSSLIPLNDQQACSELGRAICIGFFDYDNTLTWISTSCFIHLICNDHNLKTEFLKLHFIFEEGNETKPNSQPASLIDRCLYLLNLNSFSSFSKINVISFLVVWMFDNQTVALEYLKNKHAISLPLSVLLSLSSENGAIVHGMFAVLLFNLLLNLPESAAKMVKSDISSRFSLSDIKSQINNLTHHSDFISCSKSPRPVHSNGVVFDYEVTCIIKRIQVAAELMSHEPNKNIPPHVDFPEIIKQKDERIAVLESKIAQLEEDLAVMREKQAAVESETDWKSLYQEMSKDFQNLMEIYEKLLKISECQEIEIKTLKEKLEACMVIDNNLSPNKPPTMYPSSCSYPRYYYTPFYQPEEYPQNLPYDQQYYDYNYCPQQEDRSNQSLSGHD